MGKNANWKYVDDFANAERDLKKAMKRATDETAPKVLKKAKAAAPVDTGRLRDSGEINDVHVGSSLGHAETSIDFTASYAGFVHNGYFNVKAGRFIAGRPFLSNALNQSLEDLEDAAEKELKALGAKKVRRI